MNITLETDSNHQEQQQKRGSQQHSWLLEPVCSMPKTHGCHDVENIKTSEVVAFCIKTISSGRSLKSMNPRSSGGFLHRHYIIWKIIEVNELTKRCGLNELNFCEGYWINAWF